MRLMGVDVVYALSPQAKGKIERPYRWLQDRIVRTCARERITSIDDGRSVLRDEVDRYNNRRVLRFHFPIKMTSAGMPGFNSRFVLGTVIFTA